MKVNLYRRSQRSLQGLSLLYPHLPLKTPEVYAIERPSARRRTKRSVFYVHLPRASQFAIELFLIMGGLALRRRMCN